MRNRQPFSQRRADLSQRGSLTTKVSEHLLCLDSGPSIDFNILCVDTISSRRRRSRFLFTQSTRASPATPKDSKSWYVAIAHPGSFLDLTDSWSIFTAPAKLSAARNEFDYHQEMAIIKKSAKRRLMVQDCVAVGSSDPLYIL